MGFGVWGLGFRGSGFRVWGLGVQGLGFGGLGFRGSGFRVWCLRFRGLESRSTCTSVYTGSATGAENIHLSLEPASLPRFPSSTLNPKTLNRNRFLLKAEYRKQGALIIILTTIFMITIIVIIMIMIMIMIMIIMIIKGLPENRRVTI